MMELSLNCRPSLRIVTSINLLVSRKVLLREQNAQAALDEIAVIGQCVAIPCGAFGVIDPLQPCTVLSNNNLNAGPV